MQISDLLVYSIDSNGLFVELEVIRSILETINHSNEIKWTCSQFHFDNEDPNRLLFFADSEVFSYDIRSRQGHTLYQMSNRFVNPPRVGVFSEDQTKCMVTSKHDILFIDTECDAEIDIDH